MNNKSILYGLILLITLSLTLGVVSAADFSNETLSVSFGSAPIVDDVSETNNEFISEAVNDDILSASNENDELSLSGSKNNGLLSARNEDDKLSAGHGTFDNLKNELKGSYVTLSKDYIADKSSMVQISSSMTVDGQGHYIDGNQISRILYIKSGTVTLKNINFINGYHDYNTVEYGAAITVASGANVIMENCTVSNSVGSYGAVVWQADNGIITNSKFINNTGFVTEQSNTNLRYGGAIQWAGNNGMIKDSQFTLNSAYHGGAIHWSGSSGTIDNVIFYKNDATLDAGALLVTGQNVNVLNSLFVENTAARDGGALVYSAGSSNSNVDKTNFQRNKATMGGGALIDGNRNSITNSQFISNHAAYGGGALMEQGTNNLIDNCIIYNNTAITYAGGASIKTGTIKNSIVESNNAIVGAGIYIIEGLITNVTFTDNNGSVGQDIAVVNESTISDSDFNYIEYYNLTDYLSVKSHQGQNDYCILENGDIAFCIEEGVKGPYGGYVDTSLNLLINHKSGENVAEYVKLLIYNNFNEAVLGESNKQLARDIWNFTETDFRNNPSASYRVKDAIRRYDAGERVPNTNAVKQVNGGYIIYNFYTLITGSSNQNLFAFNITEVNNINPDLEVRKITLNKTVNVGEKTSFTIVVKNTGNVGLTNVFVKELSYEGLIYNSFTGDNWVNSGNVFKYLNPLEIGESANFTVEFNTIKPGNFTNIVVAGSSETEDKITNNTTEVVDEPELKPGMVVDKVSLTPSVLVGEQTLFLITVTNTGEVALGDVFVVEDIPDGLTYADYTDKALWSKVDNTFYYNGVLGVGESANFTIVFDTHVNGTFVNCVVAGSNGTDNDTAENKTVVKKPGMVVDKVSLTPSVLVGEQTLFLITVTNTGEVALGDVFVVEDIPDGLTYADYTDKALWSKVDNTFYYNGVLGVGESANFTIVFDTHVNGTFVNCVVAGSNGTDNDTAENKTVVKKPGMVVDKVSLTPSVLVGEQTLFLITVTNTGEVALGDVFVVEDIPDGLTYADYTDKALWSKVDNTFYYNGVLGVGESANFTIAFDTHVNGTFVNCVVAGSNSTDNETVNNNTTVIQPNLAVEKITITPIVYIGEEAIFEIAVKNIGEVKLHDVFVEETYFDDGLSYNSWIIDEDWTYSFVNGKHRWTLNEVLNPGEIFTFFVVFNTNKVGTFNNIVTAGSDKTDNKTAENNTLVYDSPDTPELNSSNNPKLSVEKIALEKLLNINEQAIFEIIVHNIGDVELNGVTVSEIEHDGLKYSNWYDHSGLWTYNGDFTWTLNGKLYIGEYATFFVVFDTIKTGEFINIVSAISDETPEKYANDTVEVINNTPETPEEPTPEIPEEPVVPETPEEPTPEIPEEPVVPEKPVLEEPEEPTPEIPEEPVVPETPEEPTPVVPEEPVVPETPEEPTPVVPEEPVVPETPEEPTPVVPEEPVVPETPEKPTPVVPEEPVVPETPEKPTPVVPVVLETPGTPEKPVNNTTETSKTPNNVNNANVLPEAGNPLIIVLLALIVLGTATLRRRK